MNGQDLAAAILSNEDFVRNYESGQFWRGGAYLPHLKKIFSWGHVNHALSTSRITNDRFRLSAKDDYLRPNKQVFRPVRDKFGRPTDILSIAELHRMMRQGVTGVLEAVNELFPDIGAFTEKLGTQYYARSTANAYMSFGSTSGFGAHNDDHDVIVLQIEGRKKWRFFGAPGVSSKATVNHLKLPTEEDVAEDVILTEGEMIFVPKGTWHDVVAINEPSLHLTVSLVYPTLADFLQWLLEQHCYDLPYRDIKIREGCLENTAMDCVSFLAQKVNEQSMATFLQSHYARYAATRVRPSFPSLNRVEPNESFRTVPFNFIDLKKGAETSGHSIFAFGQTHQLSTQEYKILTQLPHDGALSGADLAGRLGRDSSAWEWISRALESLLDRGLVTKNP